MFGARADVLALDLAGTAAAITTDAAEVTSVVPAPVLAGELTADSGVDAVTRILPPLLVFVCALLLLVPDDDGCRGT